MLPWAQPLTIGAALLLSAAPAAAQAPAARPTAPAKQSAPEKLTPEQQKQQALEAKLLAPYLTPDGKLRNPVEVRDEETSRGGTFAGLVYRVEANGNWSVTRIFRRQPSLVGQGTLSPKQIRSLALVLAENDVQTLPSAGWPLVNPHMITISYGGSVGVLVIGVDQRLPNPDAPAPAMYTRYSAIYGAVRSAINSSAQ